MAEFCVSQKLRASHGKIPQEKDFKIEVVVEGQINLETEYAGGVDFFVVLRNLALVLQPLRGQYLRPILNEAGLKTSVLEAMGVYIFRKLQDKANYPIKSVKVWESDSLSATVFKEDCGFNISS